MARTIKTRTFGNVTVANARQAAVAIERAVAHGKTVTYADVPPSAQRPRKATRKGGGVMADTDRPVIADGPIGPSLADLASQAIDTLAASCRRVMPILAAALYATAIWALLVLTTRGR